MYWRFAEDKFLELDRDGRIWWGKDGDGTPRLKRFLSEVKQGLVPQTLWPYSEVGHTQDAKKQLLSILDFADSGEVFVTPKPTTLIQRILQIATDKDSIVLDSFAGSGTTAHAVLKQNREDDGNRRFVLLEMEDYADSLTAERVRRVISGRMRAGATGEALGGGFSFFELGPAMFLQDGSLNPIVDPDTVRSYVWHSETGAALEKAGTEGGPYYLGRRQDTVYYLCLDGDRAIDLDYELLRTLPIRSESCVIYAHSCSLTNDFLLRQSIVFKKIPRDMERF
jgi:adenine-specific DNA-methyltransferase